MECIIPVMARQHIYSPEELMIGRRSGTRIMMPKSRVPHSKTHASPVRHSRGDPFRVESVSIYILHMRFPSLCLCHITVRSFVPHNLTRNLGTVSFPRPIGNSKYNSDNIFSSHYFQFHSTWLYARCGCCGNGNPKRIYASQTPWPRRRESIGHF